MPGNKRLTQLINMYKRYSGVVKISYLSYLPANKKTESLEVIGEYLFCCRVLKRHIQNLVKQLRLSICGNS